MYERHFGFSIKPFAMTPDPAFLFPSRRHAMALSMLEYSLESQASFAVLTGAIGSGKTTLVRKLLTQMGDLIQVGLVSHTHSRFRSIHGWALSSLGIAPRSQSDVALYETLVDALRTRYARGGRTLLIVDEAQNLSVEILEELRLLSNLNSERNLLLQILLVGQPELRATLSRPELKQFAQRVSVFFELKSLECSETHAYIQHRLQVAGGDASLFRPEAIDLIHARTRGVPRLVNQLCDFSLVYAFAEKHTEIDSSLVNQVIHDCSSGLALAAAKATEADGSFGMANSSAA
jgi:type II secretory pathway predicted ATPase ExeA